MGDNISKNYALVYLVNNDVTGNLDDESRDPDFKNPPTLGKCRPDIRNSIYLNTGSKLLFIARIKVNRKSRYFIKGYFKVSKKLNIIEAYEQFKDRKNIIITEKTRAETNKHWDQSNWEEAFKKYNLSEVPYFLNSFFMKDQYYYQKEDDEHGIDNWKCRRIYNCYIQTFRNCLSWNECIKQKNTRKLPVNYILGDSKDNYDYSDLRIEWYEIMNFLKKPVKLMRGNTHPQIELNDGEFGSIISYIKSK